MSETFLSAIDTARPLLDQDQLRRSWAQPSSLERMTNGELAGHLARALFNVATYLDTTSPEDPVDAAAYFTALSGVRAPDLDENLATSVRERAREEAEAGLDALRDRWDETRAGVEAGLRSVDPSTVIAVKGSAMAVEDYLVTRMVEVVIHTDDLATGLGVETPIFEPEVWTAVLDCLWRIARRTSEPLAIMRRMSRIERSEDDPLRVF